MTFRLTEDFEKKRKPSSMNEFDERLEMRKVERNDAYAAAAFQQPRRGFHDAASRFFRQFRRDHGVEEIV